MGSGLFLRGILGGLVFCLAGCASGKIVSISANDPDGPGVDVTVVSDGLAHRANLCELEILLSDYYCLRKIPLNPQEPEPQQKSFTVTEWQEYKDLPKDNRRDRLVPAKELMRVRFLFNKGAVMDDKIVDRPSFKPYPPGKAPKQPPPEKPPVAKVDEPTRTVRPVLDDRRPLGRSPEEATAFEFRSGTTQIPCRIRAGTTPQYARLEPPPGRVKLVVKIRSLAPAGQSTWWRMELLDREGNSLPEPVQEFQFIESGNQARAELEWSFDGSPHILKFSSGSEEGDDLTVDCTLLDSGIPR